MNENEPASETTSTGLSSEERAAAFANTRQRLDRNAAFRAGRTPVPPKFILWIIVGFIVLGGGGAILEHYFGNVGQNAASTATTTTTSAQSLQVTPNEPETSPSSLSPTELIDVKYIGTQSAATFALTDQKDASWRLSAQRGKVVILTFMNTTCNDICPVLAGDIKDTELELGADASKVVFAVVNTDAHDTSPGASPLAMTSTGLSNYANVFFLEGTLHQLNRVWAKYGVLVKTGSTMNEVAHNNVLYFINARGNLRAQATPVGSENANGVFSLSAAMEQRSAEGIVQVAVSLLS
jgi:cytochrome oxidase Cu insertion factor (SCO1/SenC/PrrC family)